MSLLNLKGVKSEVEGKPILKGVDLTIDKGEVHVIMGPNGAGKSTLASILVGHPKHEIVDGEIILDGENINDLEVDERAQRGIFLSFQYPEEIPGLTVEDFLRTAKEAVTGEKQYMMQFHNELIEKMEKLHINPEYAERHLNVGFSGGEKKKNEISSSQEPSYTSGFVDIFLALDGLEDAFSELKHISIVMNKHFMYESGEISEEEFLNDGILNVEIVDAGDEE